VASVQIRNRLDNLRRDRKRTEDELESQAHAAGADAFVHKSKPPVVLINALRAL